MRRRRPEGSGDGWTSEVSSGLALAGFLTLVFAGLTVLAMGPLTKFDAYFSLEPPPPAWRPVLYVLDRIGQRSVCLPILGVVAFVLCRRLESWRPAVVAAVSVFSLNLVVLILKVGLGRGFPNDATLTFFSGGIAYPSGHSANVVTVYGLIGYLVMNYGRPGRKTRIALWGVVPLLSLVMVGTSLTLNWHWLTDLVGGLLVGAIVLQLTVAVDRAIPADAFRSGWRQGVRNVVRTLRPTRSATGPSR